MNRFDLVQSFLEQRERGKPIQALAADFQSAVECVGIPSFACGLHVDPANPPRGTYMHHNYPRRWIETVSHFRLHEIDPVFTYAEQHQAPFFWNDLRFRAQLEPEHRAILAAAGALGIRHGFTMPLHRRGRGEPPSSCSFVLDSRAIDERSCFIAQLLAACFHEDACNASSLKSTVRAPIRLSQPERACLELAAMGLTDWRISELLKISESTVRTHIGHAMQRLGVPTREQAVAHALALRQIRLGDIKRAKDSTDTRLAHEAAYWFMLLNDGEIGQGTHLGYARWLAESPAHAEAIEFLLRLCNSQHASAYLLSRTRWRMQ